MAWNFLDDLEICQIAWKVPKCTGKFSAFDNRGRKETIGKVSRWPRKFPDGLGSFQMASKFPDGVDNFQMAWNVSRWPGMFLDGLECFQMAWNVFR